MRCPWAIEFGTRAHGPKGPMGTRCKLEAGHVNDAGHVEHEGRGLPAYRDQRIFWYAGDRREFETERTDDWAWGG